MDINIISHLAAERKIIWTDHSVKRMQEKDISRQEVLECISKGEIIEDYPDDYPFPSCLIFALVNNNRPIHVVLGCNGENIYIITVYIPDLIRFEADMKTRRKN